MAAARQVETTSTLFATIRDSCADACPVVLAEYEDALSSPSLTLAKLEQMEFEALGSLLDLDGEFVAARGDTASSPTRPPLPCALGGAAVACRRAPRAIAGAGGTVRVAQPRAPLPVPG